MVDAINLSSVLTGFSLAFNFLLFVFIIYYYRAVSSTEKVVDFMILLLLLACFITSITAYYINFYGKSEQDATNDNLILGTTVLNGIIVIMSFLFRFTGKRTPVVVTK